MKYILKSALVALLSTFLIQIADAMSVIQDGTFQNQIGTGGNLTPWSDWTNAGVTRQVAPSGIPGNYAAMPYGTDLYQDFSGQKAGTYTLSFFVQNQTPWPAELVLSFQQNGGGGWYDYLNVLDLPASTGFIAESFTVNLAHPPEQFYFSNSYDSTTYGAAAYFYPELANSINPAGTIIDVADVSLTPVAGVPELGTWAMMLLGFAGLGSVAHRRKTKMLLAVVAG